MKVYIIIKYRNSYLLSTREALQDYYKKGILMYNISYKFKKDMLKYIENNAEYKNDTLKRTIII